MLLCPPCLSTNSIKATTHQRLVQSTEYNRNVLLSLHSSQAPAQSYHEKNGDKHQYRPQNYPARGSPEEVKLPWPYMMDER